MTLAILVGTCTCIVQSMNISSTVMTVQEKSVGYDACHWLRKNCVVQQPYYRMHVYIQNIQDDWSCVDLEVDGGDGDGPDFFHYNICDHLWQHIWTGGDSGLVESNGEYCISEGHVPHKVWPKYLLDRRKEYLIHRAKGEPVE